MIVRTVGQFHGSSSARWDLIHLHQPAGCPLCIENPVSVGGPLRAIVISGYRHKIDAVPSTGRDFGDPVRSAASMMLENDPVPVWRPLWIPVGISMIGQGCFTAASTAHFPYLVVVSRISFEDKPTPVQRPLRFAVRVVARCQRCLAAASRWHFVYLVLSCRIILVVGNPLSIR